MSEDQKTVHKLMFIATIKLMSDQSSYLQGELKMQLKADFNNMVKRADELAAKLESVLGDEAKDGLQEIVDVLNDEMCRLREQINVVE